MAEVSRQVVDPDPPTMAVRALADHLDEPDRTKAGVSRHQGNTKLVSQFDVQGISESQIDAPRPCAGQQFVDRMAGNRGICEPGQKLLHSRRRKVPGPIEPTKSG